VNMIKGNFKSFLIKLWNYRLHRIRPILRMEMEKDKKIVSKCIIRMI